MKNLFILITCFFPVLFTNAQTLPQEVKVGLPSVLVKNLIKEKDIASINSSNEWGQRTKSSLFWVVWSDRSDNTTYKGPSTSSGEKGHLEFREQVRIAEIKNDFAHVYVEAKDQEHRQYPKIYNPTDKGWIPMSHLLLWGSCPANERGILNKALIVVNLTDEINDKKNMFRIFTNPNRKSHSGFATSSINFYFVMKEDRETKMVLLAQEAKLGNNGQLLYGWLSKDSYVKWNQRSCLEPNWSKDEVAYFKNRGETLLIYEKADFSGKAITKPFKFGDIFNNLKRDIDRYRMPQGSLRYPILDSDNQTNENNYHCNVFASNGNLTEAAQHNQKIIDEQNVAVNNMESVNLIIAIDGTRSMEPFYSPVKDAIKRGYTSFVNNNFTVKVGIVIYRDYKDGQYLTEVLPLTKHNDPRIAEFLDKGGDGNYGIKSAPGDDVPEALYEGLMIATDKQKMKFGEKESNLLLVVGDCGNRLNDNRSPSQNEIVKRLIENQFQVVAFQVRRMNQQPYNWFQDQMGQIIVNNIKGQIEPINQKSQKKLKVGWKPTASGYELISDLSENLYIGSLLRPKLGGDMEVAVLSNFIKESLTAYSEAISTQRDRIFWGGVNTKDSLDASFDEAFLEAKIGKQYVEYIKKTNSIMSAPGYAPRKNSENHDYWKTVIYISSDELDHLLSQLQGVYNAAKTSDYTNREPYVNAFKGIIRAMIPEKTIEQMNSMSQEEIMAEIAGLNTRTKTTKEYSLQQILNPKVVDNQKYAQILLDFESKYENLIRIKTSEYPFSLKVRNNIYYWIPTDLIP